MKKLILKASCLAAMFFAGQTANADVFYFDRITANAAQNVESQFSVEVLAVGSTHVSFTFRNTALINSSISEIYFDDGFFAPGPSIFNSGTVFTSGANPADLPGGNAISPAFVASSVFNVDAQGNPSQGIDVNTDFLTLTFGLGSYANFAAVIAALQNPTDDPGPNTGASLRIGLHVRSIGAGGGDSDGFINTPGVPDGGTTLLLLGSALTGLGVLRRKFGMKLS